MTEKEQVTIVGAGMAGLTAGAYLTKEGFDVLILEKNDRCGGLVNTFNQQGFFFDSGPRAFVNSGMVKPILKELGIQWDFLENRISIGIEEDMLSITSMANIEEYKQILKKYYPDSHADIDQIIEEIRKLSEYTRILYEFDNPNFVDIMSDKKYIFTELLPWLFKFLNATRKMNKYDMPMEDFIEGFTDNQSLIDIITQLFFRNTPTHFAMGYFYVYQDYFYPKGGTGALPRLLQEKILGSGGEIKFDTQITEVYPAERKVLDAQGNSYDYDHLIWASDLKTLYTNLNTAGLEPKIIEHIASEKVGILSGKGAESVFIQFLAVDRPPSYFQSRGGPHFFYSPTRRGLGDIHREKREAILEGFENQSKSEIIAWLNDFCDYNTFEVSIPVLRDPALAPEGKTGIMISCLADYALFEKIEKAGWYDEFKEIMEKKIIDVFSKTLFPDFDEDILFNYSSTPLTISRISGSTGGAITGWSFESEIPVIDKLKDVPKSALTPIPEVYQAGQWAYAPSGVPIAMLTGWYATQRIIKG